MRAPETGRKPRRVSPWTLRHRKDIPEILTATDVLCISSNYEGTPLVLFEPMAAGKAVVSTAVDGCREVIQDKRTGLLVPPNDPEKFGEALIKVIEDVPMRARLGKAARAASKRYDISECMRLMQQIYDDVLREKGVRRPFRLRPSPRASSRR